MKKKKLKNRILKTITAIAGAGVVVSGCCLDSESNVPLIICGVCLAWLTLFTVANVE